MSDQEFTELIKNPNTTLEITTLDRLELISILEEVDARDYRFCPYDYGNSNCSSRYLVATYSIDYLINYFIKRNNEREDRINCYNEYLLVRDIVKDILAAEVGNTKSNYKKNYFSIDEYLYYSPIDVKMVIERTAVEPSISFRFCL